MPHSAAPHSAGKGIMMRVHILITSISVLALSLSPAEVVENGGQGNSNAHSADVRDLSQVALSPRLFSILAMKAWERTSSTKSVEELRELGLPAIQLLEVGHSLYPEETSLIHDLVNYHWAMGDRDGARKWYMRLAESDADKALSAIDRRIKSYRELPERLAERWPENKIHLREHVKSDAHESAEENIKWLEGVRADIQAGAVAE